MKIDSFYLIDVKFIGKQARAYLQVDLVVDIREEEGRWDRRRMKVYWLYS